MFYLVGIRRNMRVSFVWYYSNYGTCPEFYVAGKFNQPLDTLPASLQQLTVDLETQEHCFHFRSLPTSITHLSIRATLKPNDLESFPPSLTHLTLEERRYSECSIDFAKLPTSITYLALGRNSFFNINHFPPKLTHLILKDTFASLDFNNLPKTIKVLSLDHNIPPDSLNIKFPESITHLSFSKEFHSPITNLPPKLKFLTLPIAYKTNYASLLYQYEIRYYGYGLSEEYKPKFPPFPHTRAHITYI